MNNTFTDADIWTEWERDAIAPLPRTRIEPAATARHIAIGLAAFVVTLLAVTYGLKLFLDGSDGK